MLFFEFRISRSPEIDDFNRVALSVFLIFKSVQKDYILKLDIAMNNAQRVYIRNSTQDLFHDTCDGVLRKLINFFNQVQQCSSFAKLGDHIIKMVMIIHAVQFYDARMVQFR